MMRGVSTWAVATRGTDGDIAVESFPVVSWTRRSRVLRWPVIRGVVALGQSMSIGFKALEISANAQAPADQEPITKREWGLTILAALALALGLLSRQRDLRRLFQYHGAEHKVISCYEAGLPLTPANAQNFSRLHPRFGT